MKKINLNFQIQDLEGKELDSAAKYMSGILMNDQNPDRKHNSVKFYDWALDFRKTGEIIVDAADFSLIKSVVTDSSIGHIVKGPILKYLETVKDVIPKTK